MNRKNRSCSRLQTFIRVGAVTAVAGLAAPATLAQRPAQAPPTAAADAVLQAQLPNQQFFTAAATRRLRGFVLTTVDPPYVRTRFQLIQWSYLPDGTSIEESRASSSQGSEPPEMLLGAESKIFERLGAPAPNGFGDQRTWQTIVASAFDRWEAVSGITFVFVGADSPIADQPNADTGERWDQNAPNYPELTTGGIGDIRIAMRDLDGPVNSNGTGVNLAFVYDPHIPPDGDQIDMQDIMMPVDNLGYLGNIILDEDEEWNNQAAVPNLFETVMVRAIGQAIGLAPACPYPDYSTPASIEATLFSVMQHQDYSIDTGTGDPYPQLVFQTPQQDDILAVQYAYGDPFEDNDTFAFAQDITYAPAPSSNVFTYAPHIPGQPLPGSSQLSISGRGPGTPTGTNVVPNISPAPFDVDRFRLALPQSVISADLSITVEPVGTPYIDGTYDPVTETCDDVTVAVDPISLQNLSFTVHLFDPFTNTLTALLTENSAPAGEPETVTIPVDAGIYYITVQGDLSDNVQLYNLTVTVETPVVEIGEDFDVIVEDFGIEEYEAIGATGFDVTYGSLDGQHVADHDVFLGREITRLSWPGVQPAVTTAASHPTTVAAIVAGDAQEGFRGLARDAEVVSAAIAVDVFADGTFSVGKNALYYALFGMADPVLSERLGLFQPVSVISTTWAGGSRTVNGEDAVSQAIDAVVSMTGVTVVAAAGNNGQAERQSFPNCPAGEFDENAPGVQFKGSRSIISPATAFNAITVGAAGTSNNVEYDMVPNFSSRGPIDASPLTGEDDETNVRPGVDIIAPGTGMTLIPPDFNPPGGTPPDPCLYFGPQPISYLKLPAIDPLDDPDAPANPEYSEPIQGTSVAAAFVAGTVALLQDAARIQTPPLSTHPSVIKAIVLNGAVKLTGWTNTGEGPGQPQDQRDGFRFDETGGSLIALITEFPLDTAQGAGLIDPVRSLENYITGYAEAFPPQANFEGPTIDPSETNPLVPTITMPDEVGGTGGIGGRPAASLAEDVPPSAIELANIYHRATGAYDPGLWNGRSLQFDRDEPDLKDGRGPAGQAVSVGPTTPIKLPNLGGGPGPGGGGGPGVPPSTNPGVAPVEIEPIFVDPIGWDHGNVDARSIAPVVGETFFGGWIDYVINVPLLSLRPDPTNPNLFLEGDELTVTLCWNRELVLGSVNFDNPEDPRIGAIARQRFQNLDLLLFQCDALGNPTGPAQRASVSTWSNTEHLTVVVPEDGIYLIRVQWSGENYDVLANSALAEQQFGLAWRVDFSPRPVPNRPTNMDDLLSVVRGFGATIGRRSPVVYETQADFNLDGKVDFKDVTDVITNWSGQ